MPGITSLESLNVQKYDAKFTFFIAHIFFSKMDAKNESKLNIYIDGNGGGE